MLDITKQGGESEGTKGVLTDGEDGDEASHVDGGPAADNLLRQAISWFPGHTPSSIHCVDASRTPVDPWATTLRSKHKWIATLSMAAPTLQTIDSSILRSLLSVGFVTPSMEEGVSAGVYTGRNESKAVWGLTYVRVDRGLLGVIL